MSNKKSAQQAHTAYARIDREAIFEGILDSRDPAFLAKSALTRAVAQIYTENRQRSKKIKKLRFLIYELQSIQPAPLKEIAEALGQTKTTTRHQIRKLIQLDLVVKTVFEEHTLYCLNGKYQKIINKALLDGLLLTL